MAAVLVLGVGWYTVRALNTIAPAASEREVRTGRALQAAKQALLAYVAQYAARSNTADPGQMPCPESLTLANPGQSSSSCSASAIVVGRLPWKTLGADQFLDGYGEPLWYMVRGFRDPPINFGSIGQLTYNGSAVVAMIIAPGRPLNTASTAGTPPAGCIKQSQMVATRNSATLSAANFLECGVATGSIAAPGDSTWTNDRVIAITAAEWIAAIAGPVADRLQRQVAPALAEWRSTDSNTNWGELFLPAASTFSNPVTNGLCGTYGVREGLMPVARSASSTCTNWTSGTVTQLPLLGLIGADSCGAAGSNYQCTYTQTLSILGIGSARIRVRAPNVGQSFRDRISAADVVVSPAGGTVTNFSLTLDSATGDALIDFRVSFFLALLTPVTVTIPGLLDAALFTDPRMAWYVNNDWARYTYYSIAPGSQLNSASDCSSAGDADCMTLNGLPPSNGNTNDKRFVLALMGPALATQSQPSSILTEYIESKTGSMVYHQDRIDAVFNDRLATCPFQHTPASGPVISVCN
jgi:hypothetical protein